jgi:23S rRNA maturation mini-RNase III
MLAFQTIDSRYNASVRTLIRKPRAKPVENQRLSPKEIARRGDEIYQQKIRAKVEPKYHNKIVAIDVKSGAYALGKTTTDAYDRLTARHSNPEVWFLRVGRRYVYHMLAHSVAE